MSYNLEPANRHEMFLADILEKFNIILGGGGSGGGSAVIEPLNITENGTYEAPSGVHGYNPVVVNVAGGGGGSTGGGGKILYMDAALLNAGGAYPVDADDYTTAVIPAEATFVSVDAFENLPYLDTLIINGDCEFELYEEYDSNTKGYNRYNTITKYHTPIRNLIIQDRTAIPNNFMEGLSPLVEIAVPCAVGAAAFKNCDYLKKIALENCSSTGEAAFMGCTALTEITIPASMDTIGRSAFQGCTALKKVTISDGVTTIGAGAFTGCKALTEITIPAGVTSIGSSAFSSCTALATITILGMETTITDTYAIPSTTTIRGYAGSAAETFANANGYTFEAIA